MTAGRHARPANAHAAPDNVHEGATGSGPLARASSGTALLVVAAMSSLVGLYFAIPAAVMGVVAGVAERRSDPRAATLVRWGWIAYVAGAVLMAAWGVVLIAVAGYAASGNG